VLRSVGCLTAYRDKKVVGGLCAFFVRLQWHVAELSLDQRSRYFKANNGQELIKYLQQVRRTAQSPQKCTTCDCVD
jgi:hypothetical protein